MVYTHTRRAPAVKWKIEAGDPVTCTYIQKVDILNRVGLEWLIVSCIVISTDGTLSNYSHSGVSMWSTFSHLTSAGIL